VEALMKCYCFETDTHFTFYVEGVEDAMLENVILHMEWEKTDDKFLLAYPLNAFTNQREKELISENFTSLGQAMFESSFMGFDWEKPLDLLAQEFNENDIEWYIVGSVCDTVRGIKIKPFDMDIVVKTEDYYKAKDICYASFPESVIAPFTEHKNICPLKYFGRLFLAGAMVDVAADEHWNMGNRKYEKSSWMGHGLLLDDFQTRYETEIARNRESRINAFNKYINGRSIRQ
jgi:hypothetical protein